MGKNLILKKDVFVPQLEEKFLSFMEFFEYNLTVLFDSNDY